ncbi:MAG: hypothetical protein NTW21_21635 [Verrucomicrobia bacterium]|nr:hypothetical protein [Verrucomicrobiota bacterium]
MFVNKTVGPGTMKIIFRQLLVILALIMASCVNDSAPRVVEVTSTIVTKEGRLETLRVRDGLGGWGLGAEYTLLKIDKDVSYFCPCYDPSKTRALRVGDRIGIRSFHGDIYATIRGIDHDAVRVFIPEVPWIIDPPPKPIPKPEPEVPTATSVPGQPNLVISPYTGKEIDVSGVPQGAKVLDPTTEKSSKNMRKFYVPSAAN